MACLLSGWFTKNVLKSKRLNLVGGRESKGLPYLTGTASSSFFSFLAGAAFLTSFSLGAATYLILTFIS